MSSVKLKRNINDENEQLIFKVFSTKARKIDVRKAQEGSGHWTENCFAFFIC